MTKQRTIAPPPVLTALNRGPAAIEPEAPQVATPEQTPSVVGRDYRVIDVLRIDANPLAPRDVYTPAMLSAMADALRTQGQHDPIHVIPNPDAEGRFIIADGWTRTTACIEHKVLPSLLAEVHTDISIEEAAWYGYAQNEERKQHCDLDRAMFYRKMLTTGESQTKIAQRAGISKSTFSFYIAYAKLPDDVLEIARENPEVCSYNVGYQLHKLIAKSDKHMKRAVTLLRRFIDEKQTFRWLESQVQSSLHPTGHKLAATMKHLRFANGYLKQKGESFEVQIAVPEEKREAFSSALEALLATVAETLPALPAVPVADAEG